MAFVGLPPVMKRKAPRMALIDTSFADVSLLKTKLSMTSWCTDDQPGLVAEAELGFARRTGLNAVAHEYRRLQRRTRRPEGAPSASAAALGEAGAKGPQGQRIQFGSEIYWWYTDLGGTLDMENSDDGAVTDSERDQGTPTQPARFSIAGIDVPAALVAVFKERPLAIGEAAEEYDAILTAFTLAVNPTDVFDWAWAKDLADAYWEARRARRIRSRLLGVAEMNSRLKTLVHAINRLGRSGQGK